MPTALLFGPVPAWRSLAQGESGTDVQQLNADLVALGDATAAEVNPASTTFGAATAAAVDKLQASLGSPQTGVLTLGQVVFLATSARVTTVTGTIGAAISGGQPVLQATSTARIVTIALDASLRPQLKVGDPVSISLPDGHSTPGTVSSIGTTATTAPGDRPGTSGPTTIAVQVTPSDPPATGNVDQAPVAVTVTLTSIDSVLAVPVAALTTTPSGQPALALVDAAGAEQVEPVTLGLFDDSKGLVQVGGAQLAEGDRVAIPTS